MAWYEFFVKGSFDEKLAKFKRGEEPYQPDSDDDDDECKYCPYCGKKLKRE